MALCDFRSVFMPYCLVKQANGKYVVLNREYKPIGFFTTEWINYEDYPIAVEIEGIGPATAKKLSVTCESDIEKIFLYNDGCVPTQSDKNMKNYLKKLEILAKLKIKSS
ncbi:hypothetical protein [Candidatus Contendibacter odensensis]|uniref:Uncharacterized protein n=1 Tax=Candidatus Contendobacter odensis Run_B_J11 TaxID=1400861 RepID=A0A7U7J1H9_9GAMM|nr:hypothetical protein [Candidatus Contendobacter odensis]CDH43252.1 hypothetical protein BN874_1110002 [Candidatus Contendobacter odensis Run_B_J11]